MQSLGSAIQLSQYVLCAAFERRVLPRQPRSHVNIKNEANVNIASFPGRFSLPKWPGNEANAWDPEDTVVSRKYAHGR